MRTFNRPMFKYGGPIKEGVMSGIREPHRNGQRVGAGLVGDQRYPRTDGREHHWAFMPWLLGTGARLIGGQAIKKVGQQGVKKIIQGSTPANMRGIFDVGSKKIVDKVVPAATTGWKNLGKNWWSGDPTVKSAKWGWKTLTSPTANTWAQKAAKFAISPSSIIIGGVTWYNWPDGTQRKTPPPGNMIGAGPLHGATDMIPADAKIDKKSPEELAAEAKAARTAKLEKYLDTMGYDKAKKTAMGDALIDASAIVQDATSEAGSLKKADWGKMINKAIQTTSKRLDKPEQIREAVGLMMTKADIEKDMNAEENALAKLLTTKRIQALDKDLKGNSFAQNKILTSKTMQGQDAIDTAAQTTTDVDFRGNIINASDFNKLLKDMKKDSGLDDKTLIITYTEDFIKDRNVPDGDYTVGDNLVTIKESKVIKVR